MGLTDRPLEAQLGADAVLATAGVAVGIAASFAIVHFGGGLDARVALLFASIVAATDPVAVLALFRSMRVDRDLSTVVEGESLFNDGTGVVAFRTLLAGVMAGGVIDPAPSPFRLCCSRSAVPRSGLRAATPCARPCGSRNFIRMFAWASVVIAYGSTISPSCCTCRASCPYCVVDSCSRSRHGRCPNLRVSELSDRFWEGLALLANIALAMSGRSANWQRWLRVAGDRMGNSCGHRRTRCDRVRACPGVLGRWSPLPPLAARHRGGRDARRALVTLAAELANRCPQRELLITLVFSVVLFTLVVQGICVQWVLPRPASV